MKHLLVLLALATASMIAIGCGAASENKSASVSKGESAPASSSDGGPVEVTSCGLEDGLFGSYSIRLHGVAPGAYIVYVDFIENGVFVERVPSKVELTSSGQQRLPAGGAGGVRLATTPSCEADSVFTLPNNPNAQRVEIWKSSVYASQKPEYPS